MKGILSMLTPDYSMKLPNGKLLTRQAIVSLLEGGKSRTKTNGYTAIIDKLTVQGNEVTALVHAKIDQTFTDQTNKTHRAINSVVERNLWIRTKSGWMMKPAV